MSRQFVLFDGEVRGACRGIIPNAHRLEIKHRDGSGSGQTFNLPASLQAIEAACDRRLACKVVVTVSFFTDETSGGEQ